MKKKKDRNVSRKSSLRTSKEINEPSRPLPYTQKKANKGLLQTRKKYIAYIYLGHFLWPLSGF